MTDYTMSILYYVILFGHLLLRMASQDATIETVSYTGIRTAIACPGQGIITLPQWIGPPVINTVDTIYTLDGKNGINPDKAARFYYADDNLTLLINNTQLSDAGTYKCVKQSPRYLGYNVVTVRVRPEQPNITTSVNSDNNGVRATEGKSLTVMCTSRGGYPVPSVAWYRGDSTGRPLAQTSTGTLVGGTYTVMLSYTFTPTRQDDGQKLVCRSFWPTPQNSQGSQQENVLLYLYLKPLGPSIIQTTSVVAGDDLTVECRANGSRPASTIFWTYQGRIFTPVATVFNETATQTFTTVSTLRQSVTAVDNDQTVVCSVSNMALENNITAMASLNVHFPVGRSTTSITGNSVVVANGKNHLSLTCNTGSSNPPANITWRNGTDVVPNDNVYTITPGANNGTVRSQTLILTPTRYDHGHNISCSATNGVNQYTDKVEATLTFHFSPSVTISANSSLTLTEEPNPSPTVLLCSANSNPTSTITWYHNGFDLTPGNLGSSLSYNITGANRTNYGNYTCTADNNVSPTDSKTYTVKVLFRPLEVNIVKPTGNFIANGQNTMFINCTSGTSNPVSEITWNTGEIQTSIPSNVDRLGKYGGIVRTSTIRFNTTRDHDGATIKCEARNNISGLHEVFSSTVIDNIIYSPMIVNIPDKDVVEGETVMLACYASSKPPATFTWRKGPVRLANGSGTVLFNGLNYSIHNASRVQAGTYTCTADSQVQPSDLKQTILTVLYPPDVTVVATNTTVNSSATNVTCEALGVPNQYTYERWVHMWSGHEVTHPEPLPSTRVLALTSLTYAHSGVYTCGVSNGVKGVSNGTGSLLVKSPPIVVRDVAKPLELKASGQLMKNATVTFHYYSNAERNSVTIRMTNGTDEDVGDVQLRDVDIILPVFLSKIETTGTEAMINITVANKSQFGSYDVYVTNEIGSVRLSLIIQPHGPPEPPVLINSTSLDHQSAIILWRSGFPNGLNQTFVIQLSTNNITWQNITEHGGLAYQQTHSKTINSLASSQLYFVRMLAFNAGGESELTSTISFKTARSPDPQTVPNVALIVGGAAGGVVAAAVVIVVIIVIVWRRKASRMPGSAKDKGALVMSSKQNGGYDDGDDEVINRLYESAGPRDTETAVGASTSKQLPPEEVDNLYAKVTKKADVVYAMPDKQTGKKKEKRQKAMKSQKDEKKENKDRRDKNKTHTGGVYENAPSIMSGSKSGPHSGECVYEDTNVSAPATPKKPAGTDGLLYADLEFAPKVKGPTKIIGIEDKCVYTTIDLTKKAQPLPDSDDDDKTNM